MIIGVDIDDVVGDLINGLNAYAKKHHNLHFSRDEYKSYTFNDLWKMPQDKFDAIMINWRNSNYFSDMGVIEHSQTTLTELAKEHQIIFITSRNVDKEDITKKWLQKNFTFPIQVVHTYNKYAKDSVKKSKIETCKELNMQVMIEDQEAFAIECANGNIQVILLNSPWNKHTPTHKNITRVDSWLNVEKIITELEKRT